MPSWGGRPSSSPLPEAYELHGQEIGEVQGSVAVVVAHEAHDAVDGHVEEAEEEGQYLRVGGADRAEHTHQRAEGSHEQHGRVRPVLRNLNRGGHYHHQGHAPEDEHIEPLVELVVIHWYSVVRVFCRQVTDPQGRKGPPGGRGDSRHAAEMHQQPLLGLLPPPLYAAKSRLDGALAAQRAVEGDAEAVSLVPDALQQLQACELRSMNIG